MLITFHGEMSDCNVFRIKMEDILKGNPFLSDYAAMSGTNQEEKFDNPGKFLLEILLLINSCKTKSLES